MAQLKWHNGMPQLKLNRSSFNLSNKTLFDVDFGTLVPTAVYDVVPGDKFNLGSACLIRTTPLIKPAFTIDLKAKSISAYVSYRTIWKPFEDFFSGGRSGSKIVPLPALNFCNTTRNLGKQYNLLDYFDLPVRSSNNGTTGNKNPTTINALYILAYLKVWNDLFRNPSLDIEIDVFNLTIYLPGSDTAYKFKTLPVSFSYNNYTYSVEEVNIFVYWCLCLIGNIIPFSSLESATITDGYVTSAPTVSANYDDGTRLPPAKVNLPRDLFTSSLPTPSGPNEASLTLSGSFSNGFFNDNSFTDVVTKASGPTLKTGFGAVVGLFDSPTFAPSGYQHVGLSELTKGNLSGVKNSNDNNVTINGAPSSSNYVENPLRIYGSQLNTMTSGTGNINISGIYPRELRLVFGLDLKNQIRNLTGNRYQDLTKAFYGVDIQDYRVQMAEYIGGAQYPIYTSEVLQTSESSQTPLGDQAGHNIASGVNHHGTYFVRELGCILNLFWINASSVYAQGIRRDWKKLSLNDFFFPMFEKLGDQEILQEELSFTFNPTSSIFNSRIFGFTPRYSEYKFYNHTVKGGFRGNYRYWSQARFFEQSDSSGNIIFPVLSPSFIKPDISSFNRIYQTISNNYTLKPYLVKFENRTIAYRPMQEQTLGYLIDHF